MPRTKMPSIETRNFGLDVVRVVAILAVLLCHASVFFKGHNVLTFGVLPVCGFIGVELFFGLSGFLIGSILLEKRQTLGIFYLKRLMKITPPYILVVVIIFLVTGAHDVGALLAHLTFTQNFSIERATFFPVSWSLSIEFWFYVLVPLLLLNKVAKKNHGRQLLILCCGALVLLLAMRTLYVYTIHPDWEFGVHRFIPLRFDTLIFGVIAAVIVRQHGRLYAFITSPAVVAANIAACLVFCIIFGALYFLNEFDAARLLQSIGLSVLGVTIMGLILAAKKYIFYPVRIKWLGTAATFISLISYSLYLIHLFVYQYIAQFGATFMLYMTAIGVSVVAAWLLNITVEKAALRLRSWLQTRFFEQRLTNAELESEVTRQL